MSNSFTQLASLIRSGYSVEDALDKVIPIQFGGDYIKLTDTKTAGTDGGTSIAATWQTRTLNTEDNDTGNNCTLAANQFTLLAGTYRISAAAPAFASGQNKLRLRNISDTSDELIGHNCHGDVTNFGHDLALLSGQFTIAAPKTFELQHHTESAKALNGLGVKTISSGVNEVYAVVELWKVK